MPIKTIVLCANYTDKLSYFDDWIDAFGAHSAFRVTSINATANRPNTLQNTFKQLETADLVVLHHSMTGDTLKYLKPFILPLKNRRGRLVSFIGNEVNLPHMGMAPKIEILKKIEPNIIATQLLLEAGEWLYSDCKTSKIISLPHALNPNTFFEAETYRDRLIDIGTRSSRYGSYIGDQDRNRIIQYFHTHADKYGFTVDLGIENATRFNRAEWSSFLTSCKATLSTEAGSFYLEKDDALVRQIENYFSTNTKKFILPQDDKIRNLYRRLMPHTFRKFLIHLLKNKIVEKDMLGSEIDSDIIIEKFFKTAHKCPVYSKAISSRHFDAIGTKTLNIMFKGRYNDILNPGEHYFPLEKDYSNIEDLKALLSNKNKIRKITEDTYGFVLNKHTYKHRLDTLLETL